MNLVTRLDGGIAGAPLTAVTLSRSNLEGLLQQLDDVQGTREPAQIMRRTERGLIIVVAEEDAEHYGERAPGISDGSDVR